MFDLSQNRKILPGNYSKNIFLFCLRASYLHNITQNKFNLFFAYIVYDFDKLKNIFD